MNHADLGLGTRHWGWNEDHSDDCMKALSGEPEATGNPNEAATAKMAGTGDLGLGTWSTRNLGQPALS